LVDRLREQTLLIFLTFLSLFDKKLAIFQKIWAYNIINYFGGMTMQVAVSEFKSKCTKILRNVFSTGQVVEITRRGKVMAIVTPPGPDKKPDPEEFLGCLSGTVSYFPGWDEPLGEGEWEAGCP